MGILHKLNCLRCQGRSRTAPDFDGHLIANSKVSVFGVFPRVADSPGYRFQMQSIQCNAYWMLFQGSFSLEEGLWYNNIIKTLQSNMAIFI